MSKNKFSWRVDDLTGKDLMRFYNKIEKTETCWKWKGSLNKKGYGNFSIKQQMVRAHRFSYLVHNKTIDSSLYVCHKCDIPSCVNPSHLFLGTQKDNIQDCINKSRHINVPAEKNRKKKHCSYGHEFNEENLIKTKTKVRRCKICERNKQRQRKMKQHNKTGLLTIIPCCGFGSRLNMKKHEAKEMLFDQNFNRIIEWSIYVSKLYGFRPLVSTRKEKKGLIRYLESDLKINVVSDLEGEEWSQSVLKTHEYWQDINLLLLPDTRFDNLSVIETMKQIMNKNNSNVVFGVFDVEDKTKWGIIDGEYIIEKPTEKQTGVAWGVILFKKDYGISLFEALQKKNSPFKLEKFEIVRLDNFRDLTRDYSYLLPTNPELVNGMSRE